MAYGDEVRAGPDLGRPGPIGGGGRRLGTESKHSLKTSEFWVFVAVLIALLIAGAVIDAEGTGETDPLNANRVWLYATILTVGYLVSRGLAKSGSREPYWEQAGGGGGAPLADRVKAAAQALTEGDPGSTQPTARTTAREPGAP